MINLIPNTEKKMMIRAFYYRLATFVILMLGIVILIASITLLPSYFVSGARKNSANKKLDTEKQEGAYAVDEKTVAKISALDQKLSLLERTETNRFLVSEKVINSILAKKITDLKITEITFEKSDTKETKVSIRGTAPSRERLLLFRLALEGDPLFKKVDLPISNFVKGSNIEFYLSLTPA